MQWSYNLSVHYKSSHAGKEIPSTDKTIIDTVEKITAHIAQDNLDDMKTIWENSNSYKMGKSIKHKQFVKRARKGGAKRKHAVKQEQPVMPPLPGLMAPSQIVGPPVKRSRTSSSSKESKTLLKVYQN